MSWQNIELTEVCELITDGTHYTPKDIGFGVPFLTVKNMDSDDNKLDFLNCSFISKMDYQQAAQGNSAPIFGDVLFSKDGTVGKVHVVTTKNEFAVLSSIAILRPNKNIADPIYLGFALKSPAILNDALSRKTGSAIRRIVLSDLKKVKIPLPPLAEQKRIAAILDKADEIKRKREQAIAKLDQLAQSIFVEMFGNIANNDKGWEKTSLQNACEVINDCPHSTPKWTNSGYIALRTSNLTAGGWKWHDERFVSEETYYERSKRGFLEAGDIVLSREGTIGIAAIVPDNTKFCMGQRLVQVRPSANYLLPQYLLRHLLDVLAPAKICNVMVGSTSQHLNVKELRELQIPIPPVNLQELFATRISKLEKLKASNIAALEKHNQLFASLQDQVFTGQL